VIRGLGCSPPRDLWRVTVRGAATTCTTPPAATTTPPKRFELLLTCPVCETEKVIHSLAYEPRFERSGATIHPLRRREGKTLHALDRAA
jgi:hypothetical protein